MITCDGPSLTNTSPHQSCPSFHSCGKLVYHHSWTPTHPHPIHNPTASTPLLSPPSLFTQAQGYNASLTLTSDQCGGHWGGLGTHPLQLSFLSLETGHQHSFQNSVYSAMRLYQVSLSKHTSPWSPSPEPPHPHPHCMSTTGQTVVILFVFPNNPNNHSEEGWKWMEHNKNVANL